MAASVVSGSSSGGSMERIWSLVMLHIISVWAPAVRVAITATVPAPADVEIRKRLDPHTPCDPSRGKPRLVG
jgi:hypothetical protein